MIKYSNKESGMETWIGIDISKDTFDAAWEQDGKKEHERFSNTTAGFKALLKWVPDGSKFVMEATGTYHLFPCQPAWAAVPTHRRRAASG